MREGWQQAFSRRVFKNILILNRIHTGGGNYATDIFHRFIAEPALRVRVPACGKIAKEIREIIRLQLAQKDVFLFKIWFDFSLDRFLIGFPCGRL